MIKLRSIHVGESVWINPDHVKKIWDGKHNGVVGTAGMDLVGDLEYEFPTIVAESPEKVVKKIIKYKVDVTTHQIGEYHQSTITHRLHELAGLEGEQ